MAGPECSRSFDEAIHHEVVGGEEVRKGVRRPAWEGFVGGKGIADFPDFLRRPQDAFAINERGDLFQAEGVIFDRERGVDASDAMSPPERGRIGGGVTKAQMTNPLSDPGH